MIMLLDNIQLKNYVLSLLFIFNLAVGTISNYSPFAISLKIISSLILLALIIVYSKVSPASFFTKLKNNINYKNLLITIFFILYLIFTLLFSHDKIYGGLKILNVFISGIPLIIATYYMIINFDAVTLKNVMKLLAFITFLLTTVIFIFYPFDQNTIYQFSLNRWSHMIYGRTMGFIIALLITFIISLNNIKTIFYFSLFTSVAIYGLFISAQRLSLIGIVLLIMLLSLIYASKILFFNNNSNSSYQRKNLLNKLYGLLLIITITSIFICILPKPQNTIIRFSNLTNINKIEALNDASINTRIEALRISKALFVKFPVFGVGLGGFKSFNSFTQIVKYPHNIFIEVAVEGGVIGLILLLFLLYKILTILVKNSIYLLPLFLYALWLAQFSKEISTQMPLWLFLSLFLFNTGKTKPS